jgi:hypothetical protein
MVRLAYGSHPLNLAEGAGLAYVTQVKRRISSLVAGTVLMLAVAGCGAASLPPWLVRHSLGVPSGASISVVRDDAVWGAAGQMEVSTWGSSGCPDLPTRLDVPASNVLRVTVKSYNPSDATCPADLAATTSVLKIPAALDAAQGVTVTVVGDGYGATVSLPPRAEAGG